MEGGQGTWPRVLQASTRQRALLGLQRALASRGGHREERWQDNSVAAVMSGAVNKRISHSSLQREASTAITTP